MKGFYLPAALCCLALLNSACDRGNSKPTSIEALHKENGVPVRVTTVSAGTGSAEFSWHAVLSGGQESVAKSFVDDRVEKILYKVGDRVGRNTVVMTFPSDNPAAKYHQAKVAFELSETTLKRMTKLYESGGISLQDLDNARTQHKVSEANWKAAEDAIQVEAPISGEITRINVRETENVKPGAELFTVADTRTLRAKLFLTEALVRQISVGNRAEADYRGTLLKGRVVQIDRSMTSAQQAYGVMLDFDNPKHAVASGSNALVRIIPSKTSGTLLIARKDLLRENDEYFVYVAENGVSMKRPVQVGSSVGASIEILGGLRSGDRLITASQMLLKDGTKIRIVEN